MNRVVVITVLFLMLTGLTAGSKERTAVGDSVEVTVDRPLENHVRLFIRNIGSFAEETMREVKKRTFDAYIEWLIDDDNDN